MRVHLPSQRSWTPTRGGRARHFGELDPVVETVVLAQAAVEGWIHRAYHLADVEPQGAGGWAGRWQAAPKAMCGLSARNLDVETVETLRWLSAWRN